MPGFVKVAKLSTIPPGEAVGFDVGDNRVCIANVEGKLYALDGYCTHAGGPMGVLYGKRLLCPFHGGEFDVETGRALQPPPLQPLPMYTVRVRGDDIEVELAQ